MKPKIFQTHVGGRGGSGDSLYLSGFNARSIVCNCLKLDAGTTGQLFAENVMLKPYLYRPNLMHDDVPSAYYEFRAADIQNGTTAHEEMSGAAITVTNNGIISGALGAARYAGMYGMLSTSAHTTDSGARNFLMAAENAGENWSFEAVVQRQLSAASGTVLMETNAGITTYLQILITAAGQIQVNQSGVTKWSSPTNIPAGGTQHIGLSYNASGGTIQGFLNGVSMGAASAYTRGAGWPGGQVQVGPSQGQFLITQVATYLNALLVADDYLRHYTDLTSDSYQMGFVAGTANLGKGNGATVVFSNEEIPGFDSTSYSLRMPLSPICGLQTLNGIFLVEVCVTEWEGDE